MNKYPLIGGSICAVVLIVLASLTNVVGYQTVQSSNQKIISAELNGKELLFQTIVDMANNKEIQRVILGSELVGKRPYDSTMRFSAFTYPVLTKRFLNFAYQMGLILSKTISKTKIQSMMKRYQVTNKGLQKEISMTVEKNTLLKKEINQLSSLSCDCQNITTGWNFPVLCTILLAINIIIFVLFLIVLLTFGPYSVVVSIFLAFLEPLFYIEATLNCYWYK